MKILLFLFTLKCASAMRLTRSIEPTADCSHAYLDYCGRHMLLYSEVDGVYGVPLTEAELADHCARQQASEACVRQRAENCTDGALRGVARFTIDAIRDEREVRCDPSTPEHQRYLRMAPCINSLSNHILQCIKGLGRDTDTAVKFAPGKTLKQKVPYVCCTLQTHLSCVLTEAKKVCGDEIHAYMTQLTVGAAGDILQSTCEAYEPESKQCRNILGSPDLAVDDGKEAASFIVNIDRLSTVFRRTHL